MKQKLKIEYKGYGQLKAIMNEILDMYDYPQFDFINCVLTCEKVFGNKKLWFWFGDLRIVKPGLTIAGEMQILDDWNTEKDGTMTLIGKDVK